MRNAEFNKEKDVRETSEPRPWDKPLRFLIVFFFIALPAVAFLGVQAFADNSFGPDAWPEYRLDTTNNAVFDNGQGALPAHHYHLGFQVRATPVIVGNRLFIGAHGSGAMYSFNVRTGKKYWDYNNPYWRHAPNWIHSDMVYVDGRIYVGYGNRYFDSAAVRGTGESGVLCVDPATGATIWNHRTVGEVMPTPAYYNGVLYIATGAGKLIALNPHDGKTLWQLDLPGWVSMSSPNIKDGILYVGALNSVVAVDLKARKKLWEYHEYATFTDVSPAISDDGIVIVTAMKGASESTPEEQARFSNLRQDLDFIYAFNAKTGKLLWKDLMGNGPDQANNTSGAPAIAGNQVFVGSPYTDSFMSYDIHTGKRLWEYKTNTRIKGAPAIKDGHVFFGDVDGFLYVLDAKTGAPVKGSGGGLVHPRKVGGSLSAARNVALAPGGPVIINQNLYIGSQDGNVYSFPLPELLHQNTSE
jgi:outer membrane protein assembly factor BamB